MKKKTIIIISAASLVFAMIVGAYLFDMNRIKNNKTVIFSTWGKHYVYSEGVTKEKAIEYTKKMLDEKSKETIKNLNNPKVEEIVFNKKPSIYLFDEKAKCVGRTMYRIIYNTEQDGLLGPIGFYVDKITGEVVGMDWRG